MWIDCQGRPGDEKGAGVRLKIRVVVWKSALFSVILIMIIVILLISTASIQKKSTSYSIVRLPKFVTADIHGNVIKGTDYRDKPLVVLFINPRDPDDMNIADLVHREWSGKAAQIIFTSYDPVLSGKTNLIPDDSVIISNDYLRMKRLFRSPANVGSYHIFDKSGLVIAQGANREPYENTIKTALLQEIHGLRFSMAVFIKEGALIKDLPWLAQIEKEVCGGTQQICLVSMHTKICSSCSSGTIIAELDETCHKRSESIRAISVVPPSYDEADIVSLKKQLGVDYTILIADIELARQWQLLIEQFNESLLSDIVFIVDRSGKSVKVSDKQCNCLPLLFSSLDSQPYR